MALSVIARTFFKFSLWIFIFYILMLGIKHSELMILRWKIDRFLYDIGLLIIFVTTLWSLAILFFIKLVEWFPKNEFIVGGGIFFVLISTLIISFVGLKLMQPYIYVISEPLIKMVAKHVTKRNNTKLSISKNNWLKKTFNLTRFVRAFLFAVTMGLGYHLGIFFSELHWSIALIFVTLLMMLIGGRLLDVLFPLKVEKKK